MIRSLVLSLTLLPGVVLGLQLPSGEPVPGGVALVELKAQAQSIPTATYDGTRVMVVDNDGQWTAVVGIPLSAAPGNHTLEVHWGKGAKPEKHSFVVNPKEYEASYVTIKDKRKVEPNKEDLERIARDRVAIRKAKHHWSDRIPDMQFTQPAEGPESSQFGLRRFFNKQPRRPHAGLDIAAPEGTPIVAPGPGNVVAADNFFFSGNAVFIDHGQGLITYYGHMSEILVKPGDRVARGDPIGKVGMTGRVSGPHLHWSIGLNRTWVNPKLFLAGGS